MIHDGGVNSGSGIAVANSQSKNGLDLQLFVDDHVRRAEVAMIQDERAAVRYCIDQVSKQRFKRAQCKQLFSRAVSIFKLPIGATK